MIIISSSQSDVYIIYKGNKSIIKKISGRSSGSKIVSAVQEILVLNNKTLGQIKEFGIDVGPGSFTGIRISIAVIQGFLFGRNDYELKKFYSSDVLGYGFLNKKIAVLNKARDDAAYVSLYNYGVRVSMPEMIFGKNLDGILQDRTLIGAQSKHFKDKYLLKNEILIPEISIDNFIYAFKVGEKINAEDLEPLYIQKPIAVENYEKQNNKKIEDI
ncbi:tRNA threonylcarbamoyladenosine biosynthesis protein TsaB [Geotoga petraea]|uniref:tRNA A37 threonylcarbamoyladenosine modification protein TsaB n=1 Tax=Geotoga petraea TaxID=28234 RepID=A0A1G6IA50_9BACT|nr:hypothetical protein [Geotoga petraea]MDK2945499.1 tRNA threonylcarbamoyladenosine biosynthesis protein TsaB [Geotoga sp.]TGG89121.1 hypothetical protein E4650_02700 [Geotoga petraea]SDC02626.1 tRNA A37 threonylcarbamoyladenosine modification protein TsaB [Geotoga petraea]